MGNLPKWMIHAGCLLLSVINTGVYGTIHPIILAQNTPILQSNPIRHHLPPMARLAPQIDIRFSEDSQITEPQANSLIDDRFSLSMFSELGNALNNSDANAIISPASIQPLLLLLADGLNREGFQQLTRAMNLPIKSNTLYEEFRKYQQFAMITTPAIEILSRQTIFADPYRPQDTQYINSLQRNYKIDLQPIDFANPEIAAKKINNYVDNYTRGRISSVVQPQFLINTRMVLTSTIYFNGKWKLPFDSNRTTMRPFYSENGKSIGTIPMMIQTNSLRTAFIQQLHANVLELPYGEDGRWFMWILLPKIGKNLIDISTALRNVSVSYIDEKINQFATHDEHDVIIPKFKISSGLNLQPVLKRMGITDTNQNNLDVFHKAVIEVHEEGTTAAAYTERIVGLKSLGEPFNVNRPFAFLIVDQQVGSVLFAGQVRNPLKQ